MKWQWLFKIQKKVFEVYLCDLKGMKGHLYELIILQQLYFNEEFKI